MGWIPIFGKIPDQIHGETKSRRTSAFNSSRNLSTCARKDPRNWSFWRCLCLEKTKHQGQSDWIYRSFKTLTHRIHGAGIYANIGGILMGSMLPYIAAPWIRHGLSDTKINISMVSKHVFKRQFSWYFPKIFSWQRKQIWDLPSLGLSRCLWLEGWAALEGAHRGASTTTWRWTTCCGKTSTCADKSW